ncbi:spore germination protein GerPE [Salirhabdus salicampi]|uniref:spore germination protein GerPE n=1 Tax=Salirhabdus salicampi TaxID=476102 RepID=UPI0020C4067B|nr:spore germination protein GerPE [Salirhabdus salicampi]MCP8615541.1 spore germination protein GerPE [Salirhabdus salicampi]
MKRNSKVDHIYINSISESSIFQIGDGKHATPNIDALAVQKEGAVYQTDAFPLSQYPIFSRPFPEIVDVPGVYARFIHHNRSIHVRSLDFEGVAGSSIVQIGSLGEVDARAKTKHIRIIQEKVSNTSNSEA